MRYQLESEIKLKTILTDGYFGQDGVLRPKRIIDAYRKDRPQSKSLEPFYQSSKRMNLSNFAINRRDDEQADIIRDRNIDRLKLLQQYEEGEKYKKNLTYFKYSETEQEDLENRL